MRWVRTAAAAAALITTAAAALYVWASTDLPAPDAAAFGAPEPAVRSADDAFITLQRELERTRLAGTGNDLLRIPEHYDGEQRIAADEILGMDVVRRLPELISRIVATPGLPANEASDPQQFSRRWVGAVEISRLLRLRMLQQLHARELEAALHIAALGLTFGELPRNHGRTFHELGVSQLLRSIVLSALIQTIQANQWDSSGLRALASMAVPKPSTIRIVDALRTEHIYLVRSAEQRAMLEGPLTRRVLLQPNRSSNTWLRAVAPAVDAIRGGDLVAAHDLLLQAERATRANASGIRNIIGNRLVAMSLAGLSGPLAGELNSEAEFHLMRLFSAISAYQLEHGARPTDLTALVNRAYIAALPMDPWTGGARTFRYSVADRTLYSIASNRRDDQGAFRANTSLGSTSEDFGIVLRTEPTKEIAE